MPYRSLLLFILVFTSNVLFSQGKNVTKKEVRQLLHSADSCLFKSDYKNSLSYSSEALNLALELKNNDLIARSYNSIAGNYEEIMEIDKALEYYDKSIHHFEKASNDTLKAAVFNNIGNIYFYRNKDFDKGIQYYNQSIEISDKINNVYSIVLSKLNLASLYFEKNDFKKGIIHLNYVEKNRESIRIADVQSYLYILLGKKCHYLKEYDKADFNFKEAIRIGLENNSKIYLSDSYYDYSEFLFDIGRHEEAYTFLQKSQVLKNEIFDLEKIKNAKIIGMDIALDESKRQITEINKEKILQNDNIKKGKIIVTLILFFLMLMIFLLYILYRNNIFRKKTNDYLEIKNEELKKAKEQAEQASILKTQFISTISHELRTPLYGVVGITNMLADEHTELQNSPHLNSLKFSARYLLSLVNDLLQVNRIEENKVVLENLTFNLEDEILMVSKSLSYMADRNSNIIKTKIDKNIPEILVGDKLRLSQILMNLVSNALKFTNHGEVVIEINLVATVASKNSVEFIIKDTGVGIEASELNNIFDKFVQIDRKEDDYQGTGLGLSIVKKLINLFKSEIRVESQVGIGTTFYFTIIFDSDKVKVNEIINNIDVDLSSSKIYKVLVVEDNKINQMVTKKILDKSNFKSVIVDDGYAAIEAIGKEYFDVVLMDINMPLINGFETTRLIRKKGYTIPIIALTAFAKDEITEEALSVGINDILIKPFEASKLTKMIENLTSNN
jgi:signal transduction histidine kinase/CheY-like chemotaxis protein